jgi:serine/threonine protein kinase
MAEICDAIHLAHRYLVVHQGLKPNNILITETGRPKIVDFGLGDSTRREPQKVLASTQRVAVEFSGKDALSAIGYMSPEQLSGEPKSISTDIYSLGVLLYRLLCDQWPYRPRDFSAGSISEAIWEQAPERPSQALDRVDSQQSADVIAQTRSVSTKKLRRTLQGELDRITLLAVRKEPLCRYRSADLLSRDLDRRLRQLPAKDGWHPRRLKEFGQWMQKHSRRLAVSAALFLVLLATISGALSLMVAMVGERDRAVIDLSKAHAAVDEIVEGLNETSETNRQQLRLLRKSVLQSSRKYYEDLAANLHENSDRRSELAQAYAKLGQIASLNGSTADAQENYRRSIRLLERLVTEQPDHTEFEAKLARISNELASVVLEAGRAQEALELSLIAEKIMLRLHAANYNLAATQLELAKTYLNKAAAEIENRKIDDALVSINELMSIQPRPIQAAFNSPRLELIKASAESLRAKCLGARPETRVEAMLAYDHAIEERRALITKYPEFVELPYTIACDLYELSELQYQIEFNAPAIQNMHEAMPIFERFTAMYPHILAFRLALGRACSLMTNLVRQQGDPQEAFALAQKSTQTFERLVALKPKEAIYQRELSTSQRETGRLLGQMGKSQDALRALRRTIDLLESLPHFSAEDNYSLARTAAMCIPLIGAPDQISGAGQASPKDIQSRQKHYGNRAMEALRRCRAMGFLTIEMIHNERDFASLLTRPDFQVLSRDLAEDSTVGRGIQ